MQELIQLVYTEIRGVWRFRWLALGVAWCACAVGWFYVYTLPNVYEAQAQVFVDADSRLVEVMGMVGVAPGVGDTVFVVRQAMLGRPQLENVARDTGLDQRAKTEEDYNGLIAGLQERISITAGRSSDARNLYTIVFRDQDREMAVSVVKRLLDRFVSDVLERNEEGSQQATGYLDDQLKYYSRALSDVEEKLAAFKKENIGLLPGDRGGIFERLQAEMELLKRLRLDLSIETDRRQALRDQLRVATPDLPDGTTSSISSAITGTPTENSIRELESTRSTLLLSYTERHPDVVAINEQLEQLYEKRKAEMGAMAAQGSGIEGASNASNPVYQSVQIALNNSSVTIAGLQSEIAQHESVVRELNSQINTIPDVEARFAQLNRDYDQFRSLYNELLVRKERERMGEAGEERDVISFNVIEPPAAPLDPVSPRRSLMLLLMLGAGLGAGAGVAYLRHTGHPVFSDMHSLRHFSGRPVLGSISMTWVKEHRARRVLDFASFSVAGGLLLVSFVLVVSLQDSGVAAVQWLLTTKS